MPAATLAYLDVIVVFWLHLPLGLAGVGRVYGGEDVGSASFSGHATQDRRLMPFSR